MKRSTVRYGFILLPVFTLTACEKEGRFASLQRGDGASVEGEANMSMAPPAPPPAPSAPAYDKLSVGNAAAVRTVSDITRVQSPVDGMVIRTGSARVEVDSLETSIAAVRSLAQRVGGHVANVIVQSGEKELRLATLELKVPAARFDETLNGLEGLGEVESVEVSAQDVGEEYVDVTARVTNARRLEERLIQLLANRTGKLEEVLAVERELARVREEIERMDGRLRYLRTRVALSTVSITVHEPAPLISRPGQNVIAQSVLEAWRNFVRFLAAGIALLGYVVPLSILVVVLAWTGHRWLLPAWRGRAVRAEEKAAQA
jgi:hypothetical protein